MRTVPNLIRSLALLLLSLLAASPALADIRGRVVSIQDGDTLTVVIDRRQVKVRLTDIDAPELRQPFGTRSRQSLSEMCFGKLASLDVRGEDRYHRSLAQVTCDGKDANTEQVRRGYAWTYVRFARRDSPLHALEQEAKTARRGLWADPAPVAPWDWRRNGRAAASGNGSRPGS